MCILIGGGLSDCLLCQSLICGLYLIVRRVCAMWFVRIYVSDSSGIRVGYLDLVGSIRYCVLRLRIYFSVIRWARGRFYDREINLITESAM